MIPKPKYKKKKALRNPKPTENDKCAECGEIYAQLHEPLCGRNRQKSIKYGLQIRLCDEHHKIAHNDAKINFKYKQLMQSAFEIYYGHELFMQEFGRDYLNMTEEEFIRSGVVA